jgi:hypothetical protein
MTMTLIIEEEEEEFLWFIDHQVLLLQESL